MSDSSGNPVIGSGTRFFPFGGYRTMPTAGLTDRGFTGHLHNDPLGLVYMNARYYVPAIGRFASADTIVPDPAEPQSYNRYGYGFNNPVKYIDPSGHYVFEEDPDDWVYLYENGAATGIRCANPDCRLEGEVTLGDLLTPLAGLYGPPIALAAAENIVLPAIQWATTTAAGWVVNTVASWLCGDLHCTNEIESAWRLRPFDRGVAIENLLGRSPQLAQNFPVIDRFEQGVATSIKSLDVTAATYQDLGTLASTVMRYVSTLANWQGARWGDVTIRASDIVARQVILAVPPGSTFLQVQVFRTLQLWAATQGVTLNYAVVP